MFKKLVFTFFLSLLAVSTIQAAETATMEERVIGSSFKTLARAYVATSNIKQLKTCNVARIESMSAPYFDKKFKEAYVYAQEVPEKIRSRYGFVKGMTKAQVIRLIQSLEKKDLYDVIESVPDRLISREFHAQMRLDGDEFPQPSLTERISRTWDKIVTTLNKVPSVKKNKS